jgi:hypothetical protein
MEFGSESSLVLSDRQLPAGMPATESELSSLALMSQQFADLLDEISDADRARGECLMQMQAPHP